MTDKDDSTDDEYKRYCAEIDLYDKEFKPWVHRVKKIVKLYKDANNVRGNNKRFNILWSNVQTLKPALYARDPNPEAERRFKDDDPLGRVASEVIERCLSYTIDCSDFGEAMKQVVDDRLLGGRGTLWARYHPTIDEPMQISDDDIGEVSYEQVIPDYVYWEDFGHSVARTWKEVPMVWRKVYMNKEKLEKRFPDVDIPMDYSPKSIKDERVGEQLKKACIYEIRDRDKGKVVFLSRSYPKIIESKDDPLKLTGGFPCSKPLYATITNDSLVPVPDYALYQTQANEIENLSSRINALQKALKVVGVYDTSAPELSRLLNEGMENKMVPVDTWAAFAEKGGLKGVMDFLPIAEVADVLISLYDAREKSKADLYELTGIADIIRGNSDPRETAAAQQLKGRFAVLRISDSQSDVQKFARDMMRIMAEIIAENFSLETIKAISGVKLMMAEEKKQVQMQQQQAQQMAQQTGQEPQPLPDDIQEQMKKPAWEEVYELLQHQVLRQFRIGIETDSTIRTDEDEDRRERTEFMTAAGGYLNAAVEAGKQSPELIPLLSEILMFGIRGHKAARNLEPAFDDAMTQLQKPKPPAPNPEMAKVEAQIKLDQQKMENDIKVEQGKQQAQDGQETRRQQIEDERSQNDMERTERLEVRKAELSHDATMAKIRAEAQAKVEVERIKAGLKREEMQQTEKIRSEDAESSEHQKQYDSDRQKARDTTLESAQKLVEALNSFRTVH